jgi:hypothetical protein
MELHRLSDECDLRADGQFIALTLARAVTDPAAWISPAIGARAPALIYFMVREARHRNIDLNLDDLRRGLADPTTRGAVIRAVLYGRTLDNGAALVINELNASDAGSLEHLLIKNEADPVLLALLEHPLPETRAAAAIAFAVGVEHGPALPRASLEPWRRAFLDADAETVHGHSQWRLQQMLTFLATDDLDLCTEWFSRRLQAESNDWRPDCLDDVKSIMRDLPRAQRGELARVASQNLSARFLPYLIGQDPTLAARLLEDGVITPEDALSGLSGERDRGVEVLAPLLLEHGVSPIRIARTVCRSFSWTGAESSALRSDIQWFEELQQRKPALDEVCRAAIADLRQDFAHALEEERREAVRGWS